MAEAEWDGFEGRMNSRKSDLTAAITNDETLTETIKSNADDIYKVADMRNFDGEWTPYMSSLLKTRQPGS